MAPAPSVITKYPTAPARPAAPELSKDNPTATPIANKISSLPSRASPAADIKGIFKRSS